VSGPFWKGRLGFVDLAGLARHRARHNDWVSGPTPAIAAVVRAGVAHEVHQIGHDPAVSAYGQEAADALGVEPERVFKTLVSTVGGQLVVAVVPVTGELSLKALAAALSAKSAEMAGPSTAQRSTGYVVGGISPIGQKRLLPTVSSSPPSGSGSGSSVRRLSRGGGCQYPEDAWPHHPHHCQRHGQECARAGRGPGQAERIRQRALNQ
jgi:Cys-tRNA(Pro)/Cys-tRNA(Cys) deacylase